MRPANTEELAVELLKRNGFKLSTAESCTAGLFAATIVNVSGASEIFEEGYITYSDRIKHKNLGVSEDSLAKFTAVSKQVALEMAEKTAKKADTEVAISITGYAGPYNGEDGTPAGTVYIGCFLKGTTTVNHYQFEGDRQAVRKQAVDSAMQLLCTCITQYQERTLQ